MNFNHIYSDKVSILMLQLNQLGNSEDEASMPELYHWAQLFRAETWEDIHMLAEKNESIREGIVTLHKLSEDEKVQMECEARERYKMDIDAATYRGYRDGVDKMSKLITILLEKKNYSDIERVSKDKGYRDALFDEYKI